jgi:nucleoside-diphosphate kinase
MIEQTVVLIKPDGFQKHVVGQIVDRFERADLKLVALKMTKLTKDILDKWYAHIADKPFYPSIVSDMTSAPVVAMILEGEGAIQKVFDLCGPTDPAVNPEGTIRKMFGESKAHNVVHRSDSPEAAAKEIGWLFTPAELY